MKSEKKIRTLTPRFGHRNKWHIERQLKYYIDIKEKDRRKMTRKHTNKNKIHTKNDVDRRLFPPPPHNRQEKRMASLHASIHAHHAENIVQKKNQLSKQRQTPTGNQHFPYD